MKCGGNVAVFPNEEAIMLFLGMTQKVVEHPLVNVFDCHQMKRTRTIGEREREREEELLILCFH